MCEFVNEINVYRLQQCAYIVVDKLAQYLPSFVPRDATRDCVQFKEYFFSEVVRWEQI